MSAGLYTINDIEQGADWALYLTFQEANGTATNLTGCSLRMKIKTDYTSNNGTTVANLTSPSGGISITSAINGAVAVTMPASQTANLTAGDYVYDLKLISNTGAVDYEIMGGLAILPSVTE
jgi:hypothetical protein